MPAPDDVLRLVEQFDRNRDAYRSGLYNETQVRREFLDPFFEALGWDVNNRQGHAEAYKDVIHEDAIRMGGAPGAPDYCFRIGGARKFFVEAKKPSVNLQQDLSPAFQLRRYAWSAKLPLSILSDFEELAVYDCRGRPDKSDKASTARLMYLTYTQYEGRWDEIAGVFSREAILKGAFDRYADAREGKRGTAEVDNAFLAEIEGWRDVLARNFALRNPALSQRALNSAVQVTIDRIIFLRICEDRGIEPYGQLQALQNGARVYPRLVDLFRRADDRYNSGLFHFQAERNRPEPPDDLTPGLVLDDKPLKEILKGLYYPDSPYAFSVLPADILGQVYERFLGKVIRLTAGHQAKVEEKPEVRKAGGVYYTPTYIVDYIVRHTVGALLEGKRPEEIAGADPRRGGKRREARGTTGSPSSSLSPPASAQPLRVLDPACGSGSFLIGAYQHLLDWYRDRYAEDGPEKWARGAAPRLYQAAGGEWRLTTAERKRILLAHIYGVDIDLQAVEVTKLSLLLKVLEGESDESLNSQLRLFQERALPDLSANIKCGNSLIGPDFYEGRQMSFLDDDERYRINVFDWQGEFPDVFAGDNPGFDAVIGNPPYIRMESFKELKDYLRAGYYCHDARSDLYAYFVERAHRCLGRGGRFGMIVSNKFLRANYGAPLREFLSKEAATETVVDLAGLPVFAGATVRTVVLLTVRDRPADGRLRYTPPPSRDLFADVADGHRTLDAATAATAIEVPLSLIGRGAWTFTAPGTALLLRRLAERGTPLATYSAGRICMGVKSGLAEAFTIDAVVRERLVGADPRSSQVIKPFLNGRDVRRYSIEPKGAYLIYTPHGIDMRDYPAVEGHLRAYRDRLSGRATKQQWYELQQPQYAFSGYMDAPKIVFPDISKTPRFALDDAGHYGANTVYFIPLRDLYLLGLLNSRVACLYFRQTCAGLEGQNDTYLRFFGQYLGGFPVPVAEPKRAADRERHDRMVALVERMLELHKRLAEPGTAHEKAVLQREIDATDRQIDRLVYDLYELTEEEIRIVEGAG